MRDVLTIPINGEELFILASDNSGAIGMKDDDMVHVPYYTVAYYSFRVAAMECIAAGGEPVCVILHNFCGNNSWDELTKGIRQGLLELNLKDVPITGSTESNFSMLQSAVGLLVLGKKKYGNIQEISFVDPLKLAVIGKPLVGNEVVEQKTHVVPLSIFQEVSRLKDVMVWPVGSKGILYEVNQVFNNMRLLKEMVFTNVDIIKSSGPATCFIAVYPVEQEDEVKKLAGDYFHSVQILR